MREKTVSTQLIASRIGGSSEREREIHAERKALVSLSVICIFLLPIEALSPLKPFLYALIFVLNLLALVVGSAKFYGRKLDAGLTLLSIAFLGYLLMCWGINGGAGAERVIQSAVLLTTLLAFSSYEWSEKALRRLRTIFALVLIISVLYWFVSGQVVNYYASFYGHGNRFAVVVICACVFTMLTMKGPRPKVADLAIMSLAIALLLLANSRSAIAALAVFVPLAYLLNAIDQRRSFLVVTRTIFIFVLVGALLFTIVYPLLYGTPLGASLEAMSREYLNKNFFSGREIVWRMVLETIQGNEVFGLGIDMVPSMIYNTGFSSHNLYLQTILQTGIIGLAFIVALLWSVLGRLGKNRCWRSCVGIALSVSILVHECFEVSLTQNNFDVGLLFWVLMGIAISVSRAGSAASTSTKATIR